MANTDTQLDKDLKKQQRTLDELKVSIQAFAGSFKDMNYRERAEKYQKIKSTFEKIQRFINGINIGLVSNTGTRFKYDAIKQKVNSLKARWRKVERELEGH